MDEAELVDTLMTLLVAGHETTATSLAWFFELTLRQPQLVERMRHELAAIAAEAGLDVDRFLKDWDGGSMREQVLAESRKGWEEIKVPGSPTFSALTFKSFFALNNVLSEMPACLASSFRALLSRVPPESAASR